MNFSRKNERLIGFSAKSCYMTATWNENDFRITDALWRRIHEASNGDLNFFLWCLSEQYVEQEIEMPVILDAMTLVWSHCNESGTRGKMNVFVNTLRLILFLLTSSGDQFINVFLDSKYV